MKKAFIILVISLSSLFLGYWIGELSHFAEGINNDTERRNHYKDSIEKIIIKEDFDSFLDIFITDSVFQLKRIQFPLKSSIISETSELKADFIKRKDWEFNTLYLNEKYKSRIYDNFKREMRQTDERLFCWEGIENGINVEFKFKRIGKIWFLIEYNDFSD